MMCIGSSWFSFTEQAEDIIIKNHIKDSASNHWYAFNTPVYWDIYNAPLPNEVDRYDGNSIWSEPQSIGVGIPYTAPD